MSLRIIEPLASRCSKFRFKPLSSEVVEKRLQFICDQEKLSCAPEVRVTAIKYLSVYMLCLQALSTLMNISEGDLRRAITLLQSAGQLKSGEEITKEDLYNLAGVSAF